MINYNRFLILLTKKVSQAWHQVFILLTNSPYTSLHRVAGTPFGNGHKHFVHTLFVQVS